LLINWPWFTLRHDSTGDLVDLRDGRYYFIGRRETNINVGGLKVVPRAIGSVTNTHPALHEVPATLRQVPSLADAAKLVRRRA